MNDIELSIQNNDHIIIDGPSGVKLCTIHTSIWSCTKEEKEEITKKILQIFKEE